MKVLDIMPIIKEKIIKNPASSWAIIHDQKQDKYLLALRSPTTNNPNLWNFFGGSVEKKETPLATAIRELKEEAGIDYNRLTLLSQHTQLLKDKKLYFFVFVGNIELITPKLNPENSKFKWVTVEEMKKMPLHKPTKSFVDSLNSK